jgi:hypothetical protein
VSGTMVTADAGAAQNDVAAAINIAMAMLTAFARNITSNSIY